MTARRLLMFFALGVASWLAFFADKTPQPESGPSTQTRLPSELVVQRSAGAPATPGQGPAAATILRLRERLPYVPVRGQPERETVLFGAATWDPPPAAKAAEPPPPVQAPVLPYTYIGKKLEAGLWEVYLAFGDDTRVVRPHTTLDARYRVETIDPPTLSLTYLPLNQVQTMSIGTTE